MKIFLLAMGSLLVLLVVGLAIYLLTARKYQSSASVAKSYDECTQDGILEFYWGNTFISGTMVLLPAARVFSSLSTTLSMKWCAGEG